MKIKQISAGGEHNAALGEDRYVSQNKILRNFIFIWGSGKNGQLGRGSTDDLFSP